MNMIVPSHFLRNDRWHQTHGWAVSGVVHLLGVSAALLLAADLTVSAQPETFRWDVAMVEAPAPAVVEEPKLLEPPPPIPKKVEPAPMKQTSVVQSVQPVQQMVRQEVPQQRPVTQVATQAVETETRKVEALHETGRPLMRPPQEISATPAPLANAEPTTRIQAESMPVSLHDAVAQQPSVMREAAVVREARETPSMPTVVHRTAIREASIRSYPQTKADFGWLSESLWNRIEQLKRYPALAKTNHWEGKVVLEAVIRDDGAIIALQVAESSGRSVLDLDALRVVKQASPLILKHPLGQSQVTILLPISYKLDG